MDVVVNWLKNNNSRTSTKFFVDIMRTALRFSPELLLHFSYFWRHSFFQSRFIKFKDMLINIAYEM